MSTCVHIRKSIIDETLAQVPQPGKRSLEPLKSFVAGRAPYVIVEDVGVMNGAEAHKQEGDLCICLEGNVKFTYGGELIDPVFLENPDGTVNESELRAKTIRNGTETVLEPGDVFWIPAGEAHQHGCAGVARLAFIKIPPK